MEKLYQKWNYMYEQSKNQTFVVHEDFQLKFSIHTLKERPKASSSEISPWFIIPKGRYMGDSIIIPSYSGMCTRKPDKFKFYCPVASTFNKMHKKKECFEQQYMHFHMDNVYLLLSHKVSAFKNGNCVGFFIKINSPSGWTRILSLAY